MAKWIWLGDPGLLDGAGKFQPPAGGYAFPFVERADTADGIKLRILVRKDAAAALAWLGLVGEIQPLTSSDLSDWAVLKLFNEVTLKGTFTPASSEVESENFNAPTAITFDPATTGNRPEIPLGVLTVKVTGVTVDVTNKSVVMTLGITPASVFFEASGLPAPLAVTMLFKDGKLQVQGDDIPRGALTTEIPLGGGSSQVTLRVAPDGRAGAQFSIAGGNITPPILPIGHVTFQWTTLSVFVSIFPNGSNADLTVDLLVPGVGDEVCSIDFSLPLIEAQAPAERSDSNARLLLSNPSQATSTDALMTFGFHVAVKVNEAERGKPVLRLGVKLGAKPSLITNIEDTLTTLSQLPSKFTEYTEKAERALSGLLGKFDGLAATSKQAAFKISNLLTDATEELKALKTKFSAIESRLGDFPLMFKLEVSVSNDHKWTFVALARLNVLKGQLADNRIFLSAIPDGNNKSRIIDLDVAAMVSPPAINLSQFMTDLETVLTQPSLNFDKLDRDGYLDISRRELILDFVRKDTKVPRNVKLVFPGGLEATDVEFKDRVVLTTQAFDPDHWPQKTAAETNPQVHLRLSDRGVSLQAQVETGHETEILGGAAQLRLTLEKERGEYRSEFVVINNQIRSGTLVGKLQVPGFASRQVDMILGLRQRAAGAVPEVFAEMDVYRPNKSLVDMSIPGIGLRARIDSIQVKLGWDQVTKWSVDAAASGALSYTGLASTGGMSGLDNEDILPFRNLDLMKLHIPSDLTIPLPLRRAHHEQLTQGTPANSGNLTPASKADVGDVGRWQFLDGLLTIECTDVTLEITRSGGKLSSAQLIVAKPGLKVATSGGTEIALGTDELRLTWDGGKRLKLSFSGLIRFELKLGPNLSFNGTGGCKQTDSEKYFAASGRLVTSVFPDVETTLKFGSGRKTNGSIVPSIVIYVGTDFEADLFPGVVLKRIGVGVSLNNRLAGVDRDPEPREILARLDQIRPENVDNWLFEPEGKIYAAFIASAWIASNRGAASVVSAYVMALTMYIDSNLDVMAAGEVWLFSSLKKVRESANRSRPAMAGVIVFRPRKKTLSFVAETRPNPFIEANEQLSKILSKVKARFSFYVSEDLVDYYLEELSYKEQFLGATLSATGGYRIAVGRFGILLRAWLELHGDLEPRKLEAPGYGGFEYRGNMGVKLDFGGLIESDGMSAYGSVDSWIEFQVSAYVIVPTPAIEWVRVEKTISFTISYPTVKCKRWGCRTRWETETIEKTIIVDVPKPVIRQIPYRLSERGIKLRLAGDVGFDSRGQIGFRGKLSISVSIFGHTLSISPSLNVQGQIIDKVKRRIASVEKQVDKLRNLPRPTEITPANDNGPKPPALRWTLYQKGSNAIRWCLLVPAPECGNEDWFTPDARLDNYVAMPRDTSQDPTNPNFASAEERKHVTPFRGSVVRMLIPIKSGTSGEIRLLDLIMPWDRANMDSLPEPSEGADDHSAATVRLRALQKIAQAEAELLSTAAKSDGASESDEFKRWQIEGDKLVIVRDPRVGSSDRRFWSVVDQLERPDWAPPSDFRSTAELVALGIAPRSARSTNDVELSAVLEYERLRAQSLSHLKREASATTTVTRLMQARSVFLASLLNDFEQFPNPDPSAHYATLAFDGNDGADPGQEMLVERTREGGRVDPTAQQNERLVTRRRLPLVCMRDSGGGFKVELDWLTIQNATDLIPDQLPPGAKIKVTWEAGTVAELTDLASAKVEHPYTLAAGETFDHKTVKLELDTTTLPDPANYTGKVVDYLVVELHAHCKRIDRKIGLTFKLEKDEEVVENDIRIVRNVSVKGAAADDAAAAAAWFDYESPSVKVALRNLRSDVAEIHRCVTPLPPCQTFIPDAAGAPAAAPQGGRLQLHLPVRLQDEFFTSHFASINRFEILRQFDWESEPVSLGEVPVRCTTWCVDDKTHIYVEPFLATDEFRVKVGRQGQWEFVDPRLKPGVPLVSYFLRAIPFGETARTISTLTPLDWQPVTSLYLPPRREPLPPLALVFRAGSLQVSSSPSASPTPQFVLFESTGDRFVQRWKNDTSREPLTLEVWVQPEPIPLSGFYAPGDELTPDTTRATKAVRAPSDLTQGLLPEDTTYKQLLGTIELNAKSDEKGFESAQTSLSFERLRPGNRYRWFVRPAFETGDLRVVPLNLFLAREVPASISAGAQLLAVDGLEFISQTEIGRIREPLELASGDKNRRWLKSDELRLEHLDSSPCRSDLPVADKNQLPHPVRLHWTTPRDALDGGVEFLTQDAFNSRRVERTLIEVHSELLFARSQTDFRQATQWRLHTQHASGRLWEPQPAPQTSPSRWEHFLWSSDLNPLLTNLKTARQQVQDTLAELSLSPVQGDWRRLHQALTNWFGTLDSYFQSPLVLERSDDPDVLPRAAEEQRVELLFARMRHLFLGLPDAAPGTPTPDSLDLYNHDIDLIYEAIQRLEAADPRQKMLRDTAGDEAEAFKQAILDFDMARQLSDIIDSRLDIVNAIRHASAGGTLDLAEANIVPLEAWPHLAEWNSLVKQWYDDTHPTDPQNPSTQRPLTTALLAPFKVTAAPTGAKDDALHRLMIPKAKVEAGGEAVANRLQTNLEILANTAASNAPNRVKVGTALARQVNEAAGLTAALAGIRATAEPRDWRLIRRPHHQVSPEAEGAASENSEKLSDYFAPAQFATNLAPADAVAHYFNWLERMGFAIDLALVDEDNRYFSQRELVQQLEALDWPKILGSTGAEHQVYILLAREPDTELNVRESGGDFIEDDDALGYSFVKLAVVPKLLLSDLSTTTRKTKVKSITGSGVETIELDTNFKVTDFRAGLALPELRLTLLTPESRIISVVATPNIDAASGDIKTLATTATSGLAPTNLVRVEDIVPGTTNDSQLSQKLLAWTGLRGKMVVDNDTAYLVCQVALAVEHLALKTSTPEVGPKLVIVEPWSRRWQTTPAVGDWSHVLLPMPDRLGQKLFVGARRVSRYEPFLRWLNEFSIPTVDRLYGLEPHVVVRRRLLLSGEEPRSIAVSMHPHPSRIEFLYRLPPSGSQSLLSAEAKRRTGFLECQLEFSRKLRTAFTEQNFVKNSFPESTDIEVSVAADVGAAELVIKKVGSESPSDYKFAVLVFDRQAVLVDVGTAQGTTDFKLTLKDPLIVKLEKDKVGRAIKLQPVNNPDSLRPQFGFVKSGSKIFLTDGQATRESLEGYPARLVKQSESTPFAGAIITKFFEDTREVQFSSSLGTFSGNGVLTLLSQESQAQFEPLLANGSADEMTLFRHERLVSLAKLPYYYDYQARIEPRYAAEIIGPVDGTVVDPPTATRRPGWTAVRPPRVQTGDSDKLDITLFLNRFADLLDEEELSQAERLDGVVTLKASAELGKIATRHALDVETEYQLWVEVPPVKNNLQSQRILTRIAVMKFKPAAAAAAAPISMFAEDLLPGVKIVPIGSDLSVQCAFTNKNDAIPLQPQTVPAYWLKFQLDASDQTTISAQLRDILKKPESYRLIAVRSGRESRVVKAFG